jgi:hypothetical protein
MTGLNSQLVEALAEMQQVVPDSSFLEDLQRHRSACHAVSALLNAAANSGGGSESGQLTPKPAAIRAALRGMLAVVDDAPAYFAGYGWDDLYETLVRISAICCEDDLSQGVDELSARRALSSLRTFIALDPGKENASYDCGRHPPGVTCHGELIEIASSSVEALSNRVSNDA